MRKTGDLVLGLCFLIMGIAFAAGAVGLSIGTPTEPHPGFFPFLGGMALIVLSLIFLGMVWYGRVGQRQAFGRLGGPLAVVAALALYVVLLEKIGFIVTTTVLSAVVLKVLETKTGILLLVSLLLPAVCYLIFDRFLGVTLPTGILAFLF
jgi:putative tricarboxylic transport membrane protein